MEKEPNKTAQFQLPAAGLEKRNSLKITEQRHKIKHDSSNKKENWIEEERAKLQAYDYLCHIGEAKQ